MRRYLLFFCGLLIAALIADCQSGADNASQQPTAGAPASSTTSAPAPTTADAPTAGAPTSPTTSAPAPTTADAPTTAAPTSPTTTAGAPTSPSTAAAPAVKIALKSITTALEQPLYVTSAGDGSGRLFVVEKGGMIVLLRNGTPAAQPFLDIADRVGSQGSEQGLLSVAFHPRFAQNGRIFVDYTDKQGNTVISRFQASGDSADPKSEQILLHIDQPYANHNGGLVMFGPDGYLYIGMGDGGSGGDPQGNGQNAAALLGKLLRIDVDKGDPYAIPPDNPKLPGARPEVWALGLRNPWRFSFDRANGDLYIADVGQNAIEEIDVQRAGSPNGANYGWNVMEGDQCYRGAGCDSSKFVAPVATYHHDKGCSVTGGYVYRGKAFPDLQGTYFFGDYCSGLIWSLRETAPGSWVQSEVLASRLGISSFGEDEAGELYLTDLGGGLYQIVEG